MLQLISTPAIKRTKYSWNVAYLGTFYIDEFGSILGSSAPYKTLHRQPFQFISPTVYISREEQEWRLSFKLPIYMPNKHKIFP
jgi:hypothetical protein